MSAPTIAEVTKALKDYTADPENIRYRDYTVYHDDSDYRVSGVFPTEIPAEELFIVKGDQYYLIRKKTYGLGSPDCKVQTHLEAGPYSPQTVSVFAQPNVNINAETPCFSGTDQPRYEGAELKGFNLAGEILSIPLQDIDNFLVRNVTASAVYFSTYLSSFFTNGSCGVDSQISGRKDGAPRNRTLDLPRDAMRIPEGGNLMTVTSSDSEHLHSGRTELDGAYVYKVQPGIGYAPIISLSGKNPLGKTLMNLFKPFLDSYNVCSS